MRKKDEKKKKEKRRKNKIQTKKSKEEKRNKHFLLFSLFYFRSPIFDKKGGRTQVEKRRGEERRGKKKEKKTKHKKMFTPELEHHKLTQSAQAQAHLEGNPVFLLPVGLSLHWGQSTRGQPCVSPDPGKPGEQTSDGWPSSTKRSDFSCFFGVSRVIWMPTT